MKKVTNWFSKKKKHAISNEFDADAVPEQPRDIPRYVPEKGNLYNNFQPYESCSSQHKTDNNMSNNSEGEIREAQLMGNGLVVNPRELNLSTEGEEDIEVASEQLSSNSLETIEGLPVVQTAAEGDESATASLPDNLSDNSSEDLSRDSVSNNVAIQDADSTRELPGNWVSKKAVSNKKNGGNTYVITISNSAHFHIGTKKTINYQEDSAVQKREIQFANVNDGKLVELNGEQMLDMKDRLSEDDLLQISLSVSDKWLELAKNLGLEESTIQELEEMNDSDYNLIVYDILQEYLNRYPNTTVGFMVNVLKKSNEIGAIRKLTEKKR